MRFILMILHMIIGLAAPLQNECGFANFRTQYKQQKQHDYLAGQRTVSELERGNYLRYVMLKIEGNLVTTETDGCTPCTLVDQGVLNILPEIEIIGDGRQVIKKGPAKMFWEKGAHWQAIFPMQVDPVPAVGTVPFEFSVPIMFENAFAVPHETLLDTSLYGRIELRLLWINDPAELCINVDCTETFTELNCQVASFESLKSPFKAFGLHLDHVIERVVDTASTRHEIPLPTGNIIPYFIIGTYCDDASAKEVATEDVINFISLVGRSGITYIDRLSWNEVKVMNAYEAGIVPSDGYVFVNMPEDGLLSSALVTDPQDDLTLVLDINVCADTDPVTVRLFMTEIIPAEKQAAARQA